MAELTQQQVIAYNKKVEEAKVKAASDKAKKELAEQELGRLCVELSELLGHPVTPETLEDEYVAFVTDAQRTIASGTRILESLQQEADAAIQSVQEKRTTSDSPFKVAVSAESTRVAGQKVNAGVDLDELLGI